MALALTVAACTAGSGGQPAQLGTPTLEVAFLEERALLLLMVDRKLYEPLAVQRALAGDPQLRSEAAVALGRVGGAKVRLVLEGLLFDRESEVRSAAAFALGLVGDAKARLSLLAAAAAPDETTAGLAIESLAKLEVDLASVTAALSSLDPTVARDRLLPSLWRFDDGQKVLLAEEALEDGGPELRRWAAYALGRDALEASAPAHRRLLSDQDPWIRGWAARALGAVGTAPDMEPVAALLADSEATPVVQALRAIGSLVRDGRAAPGQEIVPSLLRLMEDDRPGVRLTAIEAAAGWLPDERIAARLERLVGNSGRAAELALEALALGGSLRSDLLQRSAASDDVGLRRSATVAAGAVEAEGLLAELARDSDPGVRAAALRSRIDLAEQPAPLLLESLEDPDPVVRGVALELAIERPVVDVDRLVRSWTDGAAARLVEVRLNGVQALVARARVISDERAVAVATLAALANDRELAIRRQAGEGLVELGEPRPAVGSRASSRDVGFYREVVQRTRGFRFVELRTDSGSLRLRLEAERAPLTVLSFLQLAEQGFYDGLAFHRVVADFVVQAGDPRGDGWGGPGFTLRDEITRIRYERGVIGMALAGADTGGSQFFITIAPQPHLDGGYTAFGSVVGDDSLLDRLVQGERIVEIREVESSAVR